MRYDEGPLRPVPRSVRFPFRNHPALDRCSRCERKLTPVEIAANRCLRCSGPRKPEA